MNDITYGRKAAIQKLLLQGRRKTLKLRLHFLVHLIFTRDGTRCILTSADSCEATNNIYGVLRARAKDDECRWPRGHKWNLHEMLHEVLLALSGHPSPLFTPDLSKDGSADIPYLSPSERALLQSIGRLSELHRKLRAQIEQIARQHASMICRAVATSIQQVHLPRFQRKILEVESRILTRDATIVGAYDIVPLAGVVGEFDEWHRRMHWYWGIGCFIQPDDTDAKPESRELCTGAALIDRLRAEQQTGFPDIQQVAIELSTVAENAWLRQVASWALRGELPKFGAEDFFVKAERKDDGNGVHFTQQKPKLPSFVPSSTASSLLFIGKSLNQVREYGKQAASALSSKATSEAEWITTNLQQLSGLTLPLIPSQFSRAVAAIRLSVSQNVLSHLLSAEATSQLLSCLKDYLLLGRGEFAGALIDEADRRLEVRQHSMGRLVQQDPLKAMSGLSIRGAELHQTLSSVWKTLASRDEDLEDSGIEFARAHITLAAPSQLASRPSTSESDHGSTSALSSIAFNDLLFPSATVLKFEITPPLDLLLTPNDVNTYAAVSAYLLAIRRAQIRTTDLWRRTTARRGYPTPSGGVSSPATRAQTATRRVATRKVWASCSAAIFLLSECAAYFEGEVIRESWNHFEDWVQVPNTGKQPTFLDSEAIEHREEHAVQRDPETLASGHRAFLAALTYSLLLNDEIFTKELRSLLGNIDQLIAFFNRLLDIQQKADLEHDADSEMTFTMEEERRYALELDRARKKVDSDSKSVVHRLRKLDHERIGSARYLNATSSEAGFEPWKGGSLDRLLMKLEFGTIDEAGARFV